ncbi:MAG: urease accessory protein UreE [Geitlerinemataceae cyanobacterium]
MAYLLTQYQTRDRPTHHQLSLSADDRRRVRHRFTNEAGETFHLDLPRGTVLCPGDCLTDSDESIAVEILARPEPVYTVTARSAHHLLQLAYHLGNRHVSLEIGQTYLRLQPDPVLEAMLLQLGARIEAEISPFLPEVGAYGDRSH